MIKFLFFLSFTYIALGFPSSNAAVRNITDVKSFGSFSVRGDLDISFKQNNKTLCVDAGYTLTSCPENQIAQDVCPFDAGYFNSCKCNQNHFSVTDSKDCGRFAAKETCTDSSGKHYFCSCSTNAFTTCSGDNEYLEQSSKAEADKDLYFCRNSSNMNITYYQKKICNSCASPMIANSTKDGCSCPPEFLTCDLGPEIGADSCTENGITKYNKCKSCPNIGTYSICPTGYICSFEECSSKYYTTGCATGNVDVSQTQCSWYSCWGIVLNK